MCNRRSWVSYVPSQLCRNTMHIWLGDFPHSCIVHVYQYDWMPVSGSCMCYLENCSVVVQLGRHTSEVGSYPSLLFRWSTCTKTPVERKSLTRATPLRLTVLLIKIRSQGQRWSSCKTRYKSRRNPSVLETRRFQSLRKRWWTLRYDVSSSVHVRCDKSSYNNSSVWTVMIYCHFLQWCRNRSSGSSFGTTVYI